MQQRKIRSSARKEYFEQLLVWLLYQTPEAKTILDTAREVFIKELNLPVDQIFELQESFHDSLLEKNIERWETLFELIKRDTELNALFNACQKKYKIVLEKAEKN